MEVLKNILLFLANNIFNEVGILIGLITLVGLLLQRKPIEELIAGALRATIGIYILTIGTNIFVGGLVSFQTIVSNAFGLTPPEATNTLGDFLGSHGGTIALVITVAFFLHILAVGIFKTDYVYLTGHLMFWISVLVTAALVEQFGSLGQWALVLPGSIIVACYWTIQPLYLAPLMRKIIGSNDWGMGHTGSTSYFIGGKLGKLVGSKEEHDTEKLSLPKQLGFFKDVNVSTALVIGIIMLISMAFADQGVLAEQAAGYNADIHPWVWGMVSALRFAAGIAILLFGVRMFLAEIVPAFKGISDKILPGTRPALDVPTVFPYAPTAVMLGFLSAIVVFLITMIIFASIGWFTLVPSMIMLFFIPAGAAVFGNATGGWRGAVLAGGLAGLFLAVGQAITWPMLSSTAPELATLADPDWYILAWLISLLNIPFAGMNPSAGIWIVTGLIVVIFAILLVILKRTVSRVEEEPAGEAPFSREETSPPTEGDLG